MRTKHSFSQEIEHTVNQFHELSRIVHTEKWQGVDISKKPEMATHELTHVTFRANTYQSTDLNYYRAQIRPNLPWADDHFDERVCGYPLNPGEQWKKWPYGHSAEKFLDARGQFNHNYMERYWPRRGILHIPTILADDFNHLSVPWNEQPAHPGLRHAYGDLRDVVDQLVREPHTRQAILPVFFPEDTGATHQGRIPCSLFYQFLVRDGRMDITYTLRSCDIVRHFRDDIYLTLRLLLWVLLECRKINPYFKDIRPGDFVMLITSLHCFRNDWHMLFPPHRRDDEE